MYFDGIKEGDTVYYGKAHCEVTMVSDAWFEAILPWKLAWSVRRDGSLLNDPTHTQILFWQPVTITPPPRPKRKVTKTFTGFVSDMHLRGLESPARVPNVGMYSTTNLWNVQTEQSCYPATITVEVEE